MTLRTAVFDIETDGLLDQLTTIHSLCIKIIETGEVYSCTDAAPARVPPGNSTIHSDEEGPRAEYTSIREGLDILSDADVIVGHNIIRFDIPAIKKVYPDWTFKGTVKDTLVMGRVIFPNLKEMDFAKRNKLRLKHGLARTNILWPTNIIGRHALDAWGIRLGEWKGDYFKNKTEELRNQFEEEYQRHRAMGKLVKECPPRKPSQDEIAEYAWGTWNVAMQDYCEQDIVVTEKLYHMLLEAALPGEYLDLEHQFAIIIQRMEEQGFPFDVEGARRLEHTLRRRIAEITDALQAAFPPWTETTEHIAKANNKKLGRVKNQVYQKHKEIVFNAGSRDHIANRLIDKYGWKPTEFTETSGKPKVDEDTLSRLDYPEAPLLTEAMMIQKRLGQLADGKQAWLKLVTPEGRIHGTVDTNGAITGRCTHKTPNVAQVPGGGQPYGRECRSLWGPPPGMVQIGADASGLELRCFGHFVALYDEGAYIQVILEGDIHSFNSAALFGYEIGQFEAGLADEETPFLEVAHQHPEHGPRFLRPLSPEQQAKATVHHYFKFLRNNAKTFIYGFLYGAGAGKIGEIVEGSVEDGKRLIASFLERLPALTKLRATIDRLCSPHIIEHVPKRDRDGNVMRDNEGYPLTYPKKTPNPHYRGWLKGLDGRKLPIRSPHAALNTLLQSAGAVIMKKAIIFTLQELEEAGLVWGEDWALMATVHDEYQAWAKPEHADFVGQALVRGMERAGAHFKFNCPISGEYDIGANWYECH